MADSASAQADQARLGKWLERIRTDDAAHYAELKARYTLPGGMQLEALGLAPAPAVAPAWPGVPARFRAPAIDQDGEDVLLSALGRDVAAQRDHAGDVARFGKNF